MLFKKIGPLTIERNSNFAARVLFVSVPAALVFILLVVLDLLEPYWAIMSYALVIVFNLVFLIPLTSELQQVKSYINRLASGEVDNNTTLNFSEQEAKDIADAVNSMHKFWLYKTDALEAQAMSDTAVLDSLPDPILMIDRSANIIGANLASRQMLDSKITDKNVTDIFASDNFINAVDKVLKKESTAENLIFYASGKLNKKMYAHIKQLPWFSKGRAVAVISLYDLSKAMTVEKMQSDFVANASHELRTPLSVISGFIETLQTTAHDDEQARDTFLKIMAEQAEFMSSLIENLLSLSRIEMLQDKLPDEQTDAVKVIREAADALSLKAAERNMHIITEVADKIPLITADSHQVRQLVQNLLDNAVKYGVSPGDVTVTVKEVENIPASKSFNVAKGKALAIAVNNKGPKISADDLKRLTERFYRMQEHKNLNIKGTGLGLAIAKQIIMRHRGNLTVSSTNYNGTTFTVYLPIKID